MSEAFLSSDDFDEQAHQLYNEGRYDEALNVLKEGIALYPHAVELHIGKAYAHLAREEFAWSRRSFDQALGLDPDHEDGLAGVGETLLKLGDREGALKSFERILQLGFQEDHELMLQVGRVAVPGRPDRAGAPVLRAGRRGPSRVARRRGLPRLRRPPAGQRCGRALLAAAGAGAGADLRGGADLPRQPALRPRGDRRRAAPPGAHPAGGSLRRAGHLAPHRAQEVGLPASGRGSRAQAVADPARRSGRRARPDGHVAGRSGGLAGGRRHPRPAPARAVRHAAERAARDAEEARPGRARTWS